MAVAELPFATERWVLLNCDIFRCRQMVPLAEVPYQLSTEIGALACRLWALRNGAINQRIDLFVDFSGESYEHGQAPFCDDL